MANDSYGTALRHVARLFTTGTLAGMTDVQLLERFASQGDGLAFEALVARHGPMVLGACRRILAGSHDVEDAFQATFLVLVRRARSIQRPQLLGPWLYGVAYRVAVRARARAARLRARDLTGVEDPRGCSHPDCKDDLRQILEAELQRLPEKFRDPIVLCHLQGLTHEQAAAQLDCKVGTVRSRLARGRDRLKTRLVRRGLAPAATGMSVALASDAVAAAMPQALVRSTLRAAVQFAAGGSAAAAIPTAISSLAKGACSAMVLSKIKLFTFATLTLALIAGGAGIMRAQVQGSRPDRPKSANLKSGSPKGKTAKTAPAAPATSMLLKYNDDQADSKKSLGGSGEIIEFKLPTSDAKVTGLRIHGSRYGVPKAPDESFLIYFLNQDLSEIVSTQMAPYALFERGPERWVDVTFTRPIAVPQDFCVALDFRAHQTKGVFVSIDTSSGGKFSRVGLPGLKAKEVDFRGDWMIEAQVEN
jgi:RNA polymerase sigma factor (sigma-70 family)